MKSVSGRARSEMSVIHATTPVMANCSSGPLAVLANSGGFSNNDPIEQPNLHLS